MPKKFTKHDVNQWLNLNFPKYEILDWGGSTKEKSKFLDKERGVQFITTFASLRDTLKKNPNNLFGATKEEIVQARENTMLKLYGNRNAQEIARFKNKQKKTINDKYGVENISQLKEIKDKKIETCLKNYGVKHPQLSDEVRRKTRITNKVRYGTENASRSEVIKKRIAETNLIKYGAKSPAQNKEIANKAKATSIKNGNTIAINGKTLKNIANEKGCAYTTLLRIHHDGGDGAVEDYEVNVSQSYLEQCIKKYLDDNNIEYSHNSQISKERRYRPDFFLLNRRLIIECDGLRFHSEKYKDKDYHAAKKKFYDSLGYDSLFFRGNEILNKKKIVQSIISNKLGNSRRIFARKCKVERVNSNQAKQFFEDNHLMGNGSGRTYGLYHENELLCCMQVRWKNKSKSELEISRFCALLEHSVIGGFSKLLNHLEKQELPKTIITFIDRRYGSGEYLKELGFRKTNESLSFKWVGNGILANRMQFPGKTGYDHGLLKIWDCGQAKWEKTVLI